MRNFAYFALGTVAVCNVVACGGTDGARDEAHSTGLPAFMDTPSANVTDPPPATEPDPSMSEGNGNVQVLEPPAQPEPVQPQPPTGDGLLIGNTCFPVCESDATDPDAMGVRDGWGWENEESCLVPGLAPAMQGTPCELVPEPTVPLPPVLMPGVNVVKPEGVQSSGFFVSGGRLFDALGNDFVIRGVNNPLAWFQNRATGALAWTDQIATTGANTVRIVWETDVQNLTLLRDAIQRTIDASMVPMVELHDVTGGRNVDDPPRMARYYAETAAVRQILLDYESFLLVNIANEWDGADGIYVEAYTEAIQVMRNAGLNHTLVIDANGYGQRGSTLINYGQELLDVDPQHNLLFSTHVYQEYRSADTIRSTLQQARDARIPFIVGEFGFQHGEDNQGNPIPIPFEVLLEESARHGFGYIAWSWTGNSQEVQYLDMTARSGSAGALTPWGNDVIDGELGIRETSLPASIYGE